jgi:hypothetical protein
MKLLEDWQQTLLRPILVSVLTAGTLFLIAWPLKPLWVKLFTVAPNIREYPLFCTAEPYNSEAPNELIVEVFVVNRTGDDYARDTLQAALKVFAPTQERPLSPDLAFTLSRQGRISRAEADHAFNNGKGELDITSQGDTVTLRVRKIDARAVLRARIVVTDLPSLGRVTRSAKGLVPFKEQYDESCYSR